MRVPQGRLPWFFCLMDGNTCAMRWFFCPCILNPTYLRLQLGSGYMTFLNLQPFSLRMVVKGGWESVSDTGEAFLQR